MKFYTKPEAGSITERMRIDSSGNVGIGNTSPVDLLHVGAGADSPAVDSVAIFTHTGTTNVAIRDASQDVELLNYAYSGGGLIGTVTNHTFGIRTNNTNRITILNNGNVGIGADSPDSLLHIKGGANWRPILKIENTSTGNESGIIQFHKVASDSSEADGDYLGGIDFYGINDNNDSHRFAYMYGISTDVSDSTEDGRIDFMTAKNGTDTITMTLSSGEVGIGTNNPSFALDVRSSEAGNYAAKIANTDPGDGYGLLVQSGDNNDVRTLTVRDKDANPRFSVNSGGNVGIGTESPDGLLDVFVGSTRLFRVQSDGVAVGSANPGTYGQFHVRGTGDTSVTGSTFYDGYGDIGISGNVVGPHTMCLQSTFTATQHMGPSIIFRTKAGSVLDTSTVAAIVGSLNVDPSGDSVETRGALRFFTSAGYTYNPAYGSTMTERMMIDHSGHIYMTSQRRNVSFNQDGVAIGESSGAFMYIERSSGTANSILYIHRRNGDGQHISFYESNAQDGYIQTSSGVVSLVGFQGSHEASGIPIDTPTGTVVSTIDEEFKYRHANVKISDTVGDKRVYGVVENFNEEQNDDTGHTHPAHFNIASVGVGHIRVTGSCAGGDLLESNGDGLAKVQDDDIIRSKTIGKVTANVSGSATEDRLVACVLYCG